MDDYSNEGDRLGKVMALIPTMYLSGGTCVTLIIFGGGTLKLLFQTIWDATTTEWYLVFTCSAIVLSQLPNLNSIAGVSLIGAITAVTYCTLIWILSLTKGRTIDESFHQLEAKSNMARLCDILNALGIIAFAFRGHNLVLEIQVGLCRYMFLAFTGFFTISFLGCPTHFFTLQNFQKIVKFYNIKLNLTHYFHLFFQIYPINIDESHQFLHFS